MKVWDIALKNLLRHFRSRFALVMMFIAPLLVTGLLYLAFGNIDMGGAGFTLPQTRVQVVNLDQAGSSPEAVGQILVDMLRSPNVAGLVEVIDATDEAAARRAVDRQEADVAVIIPADFSRTAFSDGAKTAVILYQDPTQTLGPAVVKDLIESVLDGFAGTGIAAGVVAEQWSRRGQPADETVLHAVLSRYAAWIKGLGKSQSEGATSGLVVQAPPGEVKAQPAGGMAGTIMAGMMVFFVFFTGAAAAESLIREQEEGTLARLFTTPTPQSTVLAGSMVAVVVSLLVQSAVLLGSSSLLFGIRWGDPLSIILVTAGMVVIAAGFGLLIMGLVKSTRQAGPVMGVVLTLTGMAGGLMTPFPNLPPAFLTLSLFTPHGWALRAWKLALAGAPADGLLLPLAVMLAAGVAFFVLAVLAFRRRFA